MASQTQQILRKACPDPESWQRLESLVNGIDHPAWFEQIDDSPFSLSDWIAALLEFDSWLSRAGVAERPIQSMIGYIHCCTLTMAETLSPPDLTTLTLEMLEQHGFDAASDAKAEP